MNSTVFISFLYLGGFITPEEADLLKKQLAGMNVPGDWRDFIDQIDDIIGREIKERDLTL